MTRISTHVLDTSEGHPAVGVAVRLEMPTGKGWTTIASGVTDREGRIANLTEGKDHGAGTFRLQFAVGDYFAARQIFSFYPVIEVTFTVMTGEHYHVPLLLSPFGYSTYRGS